MESRGKLDNESSLLLGEGNVKTKLFLIIAVLNATLGSYQFGYGMVVLANLEDTLAYTVGWDKHETWRISLLNGIFLVGAGIGALTGGLWIKKFGVRGTMLAYNLLFAIPGTGLMLIANYVTIFFGRLLTGVATGLITTAVPIYINEISPMRLTGRMGSINQIVVTGSQASYYIISLGLPKPSHDNTDNEVWRVLFGVPGVMAVLQVITLLTCFRHDTPKQLIIRDRNEEARKWLSALHCEAEAKQSFEHIKHEKDHLDETEGSEVKVTDLFNREWKKATIASFGISFILQFCGINAVMTYASKIMNGAQHDIAFSKKIRSTVYLGLANWGAACFALPILGSIGRKTLLFIGAMVMAGCMLLLGFVEAFDLPGILGQLCLWVFVAAFELSFGPIVWLYNAEILPPAGIACATAVNQISGLAVVMATPFMLKSITYATFWIFGGISFLAIFFVLKYVKETKGKSRQAIRLMFSGNGNGKHSNSVNSQ